MKRLAIALSLAVLLTSCAAPWTKTSGKTLAFTLTFDTPDAARQKQLTDAVKRVMERRVFALEGTITKLSVEQKDGKAVLTLALDKPELRAPLTDQLVSPFTFRVMRQAEKGEKADVTLDKFGAFKETGVTEKQLEWLTAKTDPQTLKGAVGIAFKKEGQDALKKLFESTKGKRIGLFVRGKLVSQLISDGVSRDNIEISGIPSPDLAAVFADDVNVGTHVTFTPIKK